MKNIFWMEFSSDLLRKGYFTFVIGVKTGDGYPKGLKASVLIRICCFKILNGRKADNYKIQYVHESRIRFVK